MSRGHERPRKACIQALTGTGQGHPPAARTGGLERQARGGRSRQPANRRPVSREGPISGPSPGPCPGLDELAATGASAAWHRSQLKHRCEACTASSTCTAASSDGSAWHGMTCTSACTRRCEGGADTAMLAAAHPRRGNRATSNTISHTRRIAPSLGQNADWGRSASVKGLPPAVLAKGNPEKT